MLRNLYFWLVARKHIGEPVSTSNPDGVLRKASLLGLTVETPDGASHHTLWSEIDYLRFGGPLAKALERSQERARKLMADKDDEPIPAIFGDELRRMLEDEPA